MNKKIVTVQSVDRALEILNILQHEPQGAGATYISEKLEVSKSTAYRLLSSLLNKGFVKQNPDNQKYSLGLRLISLGESVIEQLDLRETAAPFMEYLVNKTGETVHLVIHEGNEIVYIDKKESKETIRMFSNIGKRAPMHCTGVGKAILAHLPVEKIQEIVEQKSLTKYTDNTITNYENLLEHLREIRLSGVSIDDEEHEKGIKCVASPILNYRNEVVAGISVSGPLMRMDDNNIKFIIEEVIRVSKEISKSFGAKL